MSVTWFGTTLTLEMSEEGPATALGSLTWHDISDYLRAAQTDRGRRTELSAFSPGTATFVLDNRTRVFDVSNTAGPLYSHLKPMRRIRLTITAGATTAALFTGYVLGWPIDYPGQLDSRVTVRAVDGFDRLERTLPGSAYAAEVLTDDPAYYWPMQTLGQDGRVYGEVGEVDLDAAPNWTTDVDALVLGLSRSLPLGQSVSVLDGRAYASASLSGRPKALEMWTYADGEVATPQFRAQYDSSSFIVIAGLNSAAITVSYSNTADNKRTVATGGIVTVKEMPLAYGEHHLALAVSTSDLIIYVDGRQAATVPLETGTHSLAPSGPMPGFNVAVSSGGGFDALEVSHLAVYSSAPTEARFAAHYRAGLLAYGAGYGDRGGDRIGRILDAIDWPSADRDLDTGETVFGAWLPGSGSALAAMRAIEVADQGLLFVSVDGTVTFRSRQWTMTGAEAVTSQATFGDQAPEIGYADIQIDGAHRDYQRNIVRVNNGTAVYTAKDATSITEYGEREDNLTAAELNGWLSRQLAAFRLRLRKDPTARIPTIDVKAHTSTAVSAAVLGLELGYRVTVKRRPSGGTGTFSQDLAVQGITHRLDREGNWNTSLYLAPAPPSYTEGPYLTVGDATYGDIGVAAGNLVPY